MRTVIVKKVFESIIRLRGYDPLTADLGADEKAIVAELLNDRVVEAYESGWFPEIMIIEQRQYRPTWSALENYAEDDEVYHVDADDAEKYYISLQDGNVGNDPDTATTWWEEVGDDFRRSVDFEQDGETLIGGIDVRAGVYDRDPRIYPGTQPLPDVVLYSTLTTESILVRTTTAPTRPWIRFRPRPPEFSWTDWAAATAYGIGDLVYLATFGSTTVGQTFKALQASTNKNPYQQTAYWEPVDFPYLFWPFCKHAVHADQLNEDQGRNQEEGKAQSILSTLHETHIDAQGERPVAEFSGLGQ